MTWRRRDHAGQHVIPQRQGGEPSRTGPLAHHGRGVIDNAEVGHIERCVTPSTGAPLGVMIVGGHLAVPLRMMMYPSAPAASGR